MFIGVPACTLIQIHFFFHSCRASGRGKKQIDYGAVKNVDRSLHFTSSAACMCPLCQKAYKRMVPHLRGVHTNYEVFVSRLSPQMAATLQRGNQLQLTKYQRPSGLQHLKMMCPFCECEKDFFIPYWSNHIRTHTGEYTNECISCGKVSLQSTHCAQPTIKQKCNLNEDGLMAYMCRQCNWVQIDENRLVSHVQTQHGIATAFNKAYQKITIIPPLNDIHKQMDPRNILVQGMRSLAYLWRILWAVLKMREMH